MGAYAFMRSVHLLNCLAEVDRAGVDQALQEAKNEMNPTGGRFVDGSLTDQFNANIHAEGQALETR